MDRPDRKSRRRGPISWMVHNRVTPNLLMLFLVVGGLVMTTRIKQEVFPEFDLDVVTVSVAYPGASPEEVERGIVLAVEEAIRGLEGVKELESTAAEGSGSVRAELLENVDRQKIYQEIQQEVARITTFPEDAEEPQVTLTARRRDVVSLNFFGNVDEWSLREAVEQVRDRLLQDPGISQVDLRSARDFEILVEVPESRLRAFNLTISEVAQAIDAASQELPGGSVDTSSGEVLLRVADRRDWAREFAAIPIVTSPDGSVVRLEDLATVREGFEDSDRRGSYDGQRSMELEVYRIGNQTPIGVSEAVRAVMPVIARDLPDGISWTISSDRSEIYQQRLELLLKNAFYGLVLVLIVLGVFLEFKLAFWVMLGIPISFLGGLLFLPLAGVSINMISLFAFIISLGIVVDDAIIAGENIYEYRQRGFSLTEAAIQGARDVSVPITFSILTNIAAFAPMAMVPGVMGKVWQVIPFVVITVFLISWVESILILPSHLAHTKSQPRTRLTAMLHGWQQQFAGQLSRFVDRVYRPSLEFSLRWRGVTVSVGVVILMLVGAYTMSGRIGLILMPRVESDTAMVTAVLPVGVLADKTARVEDQLISAMRQVAEQHGGDQLLEGIRSDVVENRVEVRAYLTDPGIRPITTGEVVSLWREQLGPVIGLESLRFTSDRGGPGGGAGLTVELSHRDTSVLDAASVDLAERLSEFANVKDVDDGSSSGKQQLDFRIRPEGESLGLSSREIARQVRNAYSGAIALRQQRGRNEVTVRVRLPEAERASAFDVEQLMIRTPAGTFVPLIEIADIQRGRAYTTINRRDARRTVTVTADVVPIGETSRVRAALDQEILPDLARDYPGLSYGYQGRQADLAESTQSLAVGFVMAMLVVYFLLAIPFRSYMQPLIVMLAIPFGAIGAVIGHLLMGYNLSLMSMMGVVALSGVVVNDSLVLVDFANRRRREGENAYSAICAAGIRRFRPIILTTLTTFGGLAPMMFETSRQARFLIPMAISLGFGILFATGISLLLVPSLYLLVEDFYAGLKRLFRLTPAED
jgi:multidrug efflux pump subunit AcrB